MECTPRHFIGDHPAERRSPAAGRRSGPAVRNGSRESWEGVDALRDAGRRAFSEEEIAARPDRADLNDPVPVRERIGDTPDAPVVVRTPDDELASIMIDDGIDGPVRSDRILPRTAGDAMRRTRTLVEDEDLAAARQTLATTLQSPAFEAAFERGDVRGWPVGVMPDIPRRILAKAPREIRDTLTPRVIIDRVRARKLHARRRGVTPDAYRLLQAALDGGDVLLEPPSDRRKLWSLIAQMQHPAGGWWRYAIKINPRTRRLSLATVVHKSDIARRSRLEAGGIVLRVSE